MPTKVIRKFYKKQLGQKILLDYVSLLLTIVKLANSKVWSHETLEIS